MQYRPFGKLEEKVSALGFGCMRLPCLGEKNESADIDEKLATKMIRSGIDRGINYLDTAYVYHQGVGEAFVGKALMDGYRQKVLLATKLPIWSVQEPADMSKLLEEELVNLQTDCIDFYLVHCLQKHTWPAMRDVGVCEWGERMKKEGKIKHFGFSFHSEYETFEEILDYHDWDFCQIQYNYANETVQAGTKGLKYAASKGIPVAIMEPLLGGGLVNLPPAAQKLLDDAGKNAVDVALNWLWDKPEIAVVLSGMSAEQHLEDNLKYAEKSGIGSLTDADHQLVKGLQEAFEAASQIPCTKCGYCMPCPQSINIPQAFEQYNDAHLFTGNSAPTLYTMSDVLATACVECGMCEDKCPQSIKIIDELKKVHTELTALAAAR